MPAVASISRSIELYFSSVPAIDRSLLAFTSSRIFRTASRPPLQVDLSVSALVHAGDADEPCSTPDLPLVAQLQPGVGSLKPFATWGEALSTFTRIAQRFRAPVSPSRLEDRAHSPRPRSEADRARARPPLAALRPETRMRDPLRAG